jgi:hypothetical protein
MRKTIIVGLGLAVLATSLISTRGIRSYEASAAAADYVFSPAEYVSVEKAPTIDGVKDGVWSQSTEIETDNVNTNVSGKVRVMWNETGLYFLAEVSENTVNDSDVCCFWVSETFNPWKDEPYFVRDGAYYLCLNPKGENIYYLSKTLLPEQYDDMSGKYQVATKYSESGYTIEAYVPKTGASDLVLGGKIGLNVSMHDYLEAGMEQDSDVSIVPHYLMVQEIFWEKSYREYASLLGEMQLGDAYAENGIAPGNENAFSTPTTTEKGAGSCSSTVFFFPCLVTAGLGSLVLLKKKEK